jgi:hypothetical protein
MQTAEDDIGYFGAAMAVVDQDGVSGLFFRGLTIKLISNGISAILFTILWKYFMEIYNGGRAKPSPLDADKKDGPLLIEVVESPARGEDVTGASLRTRRVQAST